MKPIFFAILIAQPILSQAGNTKPGQKKVYATNKIQAGAPHIDGLLNDDCWQEGEWAGNFVQRKPKGGADPSQKTEFKILYDEKNIYIAFKCYDDEPHKIERQVGKRDQLKGDAVGVAFDSYFDQRTAFEFDVTVAGGKIDMLGTNNGQSWDFNWDAVWYAKTSLTDWGWVAEVQIPFSQLRFPEKEVHKWGLHVQRRIYRNQEEDNWQLIPVDAPGMVHLFAELVGIKGIKRTSRIEILPYALGKVNFTEPEDENPYATGREFGYSAGFDAKIALTSNFTMDLSVNPDFGQVEADPSQLNLTAFETFFEEKRPFFIEGRNMLESYYGEGHLFYSRRIGRAPSYSPEPGEKEYSDIPEVTSILGATKITGKTENGLSVGILESITSNEFAKISDSTGRERSTLSEPVTNYFVSKVQKDLNKGNTVIDGTLTSTNRFFNANHLDEMNRSAYTGGLGLLHQWKNKTYYIEMSTAFSNINGTSNAISKAQKSSLRYYQRTDAEHVSLDTNRTSLSGHAGEISIGKRGNGRWRYYEMIRWVSPGFESNDIGFQFSGDMIEQKTMLIYENNDPTKLYNSFNTGAAQFSFWNFGGKNLFNMAETFFGMTFTNLWGFNSGIVYQFNQHNPSILRGGPMFKEPDYFTFYFNGNTNEQKKLSFNAQFANKTFLDGASKKNRYEIGSSLKISSRLQMSLTGSYIHDITDYQYITSENDSYILGNLDRNTALLTLRFGVYLTPEISLQYYGMPYFSVGKYSKFKNVVNANAQEYNKQFYHFNDSEIMLNGQENTYHIADASTGNNYSFDNPDFSFSEFRSNLVFRWEFKPSSTLYLVWTHSRSEYNNVTGASPGSTAGELFDIYPNNVFLIKFNYWLSL